MGWEVIAAGVIGAAIGGAGGYAAGKGPDVPDSGKLLRQMQADRSRATQMRGSARERARDRYRRGTQTTLSGPLGTSSEVGTAAKRLLGD